MKRAKKKSKNKLQLVCVRQFWFPGVSPRFAGTLFFPLFLRLHGLLHQVTLMVKQATEKLAEFRFPPLHSVQRKDAFLTICRLFFLSPRRLLCVCWSLRSPVDLAILNYDSAESDSPVWSLKGGQMMSRDIIDAGLRFAAAQHTKNVLNLTSLGCFLHVVHAAENPLDALPHSEWKRING